MNFWNPKQGRLFLWIFLACFAVVALQCAKYALRNPLSSVERWFILLNSDTLTSFDSAPALISWDMAVLDPDTRPSLELFPESTLKIGYVSLGEAEDYRAYWTTVQNAPWLLHENPNWKGNYFVDVRASEWRRILIEEVIPKILKQGFNGLELDTLDNAGYLEAQDPERFKGMKQAMNELVHEIRRTFPKTILIANGGFDLMASMGPVIDGVLAEGIFWGPDFERGGYRPSDMSEQKDKIRILQEASKRHGIIVFNIEYLPRTENDEKKKILTKSRQIEFRPYFAEKELSEIYPQPL